MRFEKEIVMNDLTVMIVDDSKLMRMMLTRIVESSGYKVVAAVEDGLELLEKYSEVKPDLVLLDVIMPKMDGLEALEILLSREPDASVIIVTSAGKEVNILKAHELGAKNFIIKPFDRNKVIEIINQVMSN